MLIKINNKKKGQSTVELVVIFLLLLVGVRSFISAKAIDLTPDNIKKIIIGDIYGR